MSGSLLDLLSDVARVTGAAAMRHFTTQLTVETKTDGSPVTVADREAERAARDWIAARFPDDAVLGEEYGETPAAQGRRWIIDPIDGTKSFVRGVPLWASLIALTDATGALGGAAFFPAVDELVVAAPGQGCWWNGARCAVSQVSALGNATVLTTDERFAGQPARQRAWTALAAGASVARTWGDAYGYLLVATGRAEVMVDPITNVWDVAPILPIIEEAGGVFTDWSGSRTPFGGDAIATNRALARDARRLLGAGDPR